MFVEIKKKKALAGWLLITSRIYKKASLTIVDTRVDAVPVFLIHLNSFSIKMYFDFTHMLFLIVMKMKLAPKNAFSFAAENNSALTLLHRGYPIIVA